MLAMSSTVLAIMRLIANSQVVALFADEDLADGLAADRGFDRVLNVADVDAEAVGGSTIDVEIDVGLAADLEGAKVGDARNLAHHALDLVGFFFESLQVAAEQLDRELALDAADGFFHVVGNRLREIPVDAGELCELLIHGGDQFVLLAMKLEAPLFAGPQVDEKFGVVKAAGVAAIVGTADLADDLRRLRGNSRARGERAWTFRMLAEGPVLGASVPRTQMAPSSRCGRNSEPMMPLRAEKEHRGQAASRPIAQGDTCR